MNCFQKSYLWLLNTTGNGIKIGVGMLWIAFKNLIFDYWTQLIISQIVNKYSCELLSKILSLTIEHNFTRAKQHSKGVVNCFQKSYLWLLNTTIHHKATLCLMLWIAFKNLIFDYWTQQGGILPMMKKCCELLSKILSLTIEHNWKWVCYPLYKVVNCFQKSYLWLLNTTPRCRWWWLIVLWIAFKNLIFDYWTQLGLRFSRENTVVNCFQKSYLWLLNTTLFVTLIIRGALWIAFKNLIFDYWTQHIPRRQEACVRCELLSKILSLTIEHNIRPQSNSLLCVVNCFQKSYLWLLNTTIPK